MTPTERERIEKEADHLVLKSSTGDRFRDEGRKKWYIAGALAEHDKARNQAIDDVINLVTCNDFSLISQMVKALEQLKTKP